MKTSELRGIALNWAVSQARRVNVSINEELGSNTPWQRSYLNETHYPNEWNLYLTDRDEDLERLGDEHFCTYGRPEYNPSSDWHQGGPIIEKEEIELIPPNLDIGLWEARTGLSHSYGSTPLIAAMRCYVAHKLGDEIELPSILQKSM